MMRPLCLAVEAIVVVVAASQVADAATSVPAVTPATIHVATPVPSPRATATTLPYPCNNINAYVTRPSVSTSVCAVQPGQVVVETGYINITMTGAAPNSTTSIPQAFIHTGIGPRIELNLSPPSAQNTQNGIAKTLGTTDIGFGVKAVLGYTSRALYGIGASMTVPSGSAAFTNGANTYELIVNGSYSLTSRLSLFGTAGFASLVGADAKGDVGRFGSFIPSLGTTYSLPSNWYVFVEGANFGKVAPNAGSRTLVDYGIQKVVGRTQFDAEAGNALNVVNGSRSHYVGVGVSVLLGKT